MGILFLISTIVGFTSVMIGYVYDMGAPTSSPTSFQQPSHRPDQSPNSESFVPTQHYKCPTIEEMKGLKSNGQWKVMEGTTADGLQWIDIGSKPVVMDASHSDWAQSAAVAPIRDHDSPGFVCYLTADHFESAIQAAIHAQATVCTFNGIKLPKSGVENGFVLGWTFCSGPSCVLECA